MPDASYFTADLFDFLRELKNHNSREWFQANKRRYEEQMRQPALRFIAEFAPYLHRISPHFVADPRPVGGSLFRIYRDVRFSKDKTPYKTHLGIQFRHEAGKDVHSPGFYVHLEPGEVMMAAGIWHPDSATLTKIRDAMVASPEKWQEVTRFSLPDLHLGGDSLKRPPRGYPPDHPLIEELKRKDFYAVGHFTETDAISPAFPEILFNTFRAASPLMRFLTEALGLAW